MPYHSVQPKGDRIQVDGSLSEAEVEALAEDLRVKVLQFSAPLSQATFKRLDILLLKRRPDVEIRAYGHYGITCDLSFLRDLPSIRHFRADCLNDVKGLDALAGLVNLTTVGFGVYKLHSYEFLEHLPDKLEGLWLGETRRKLRAEALPRFSKLKVLGLHGNPRDLESLTGLAGLEMLGISGMKAPDLCVLSGLPRLARLNVIGGSAGNMAGLASSKRLQHVMLCRILGLSDLRPVSKCASLVTLDLIWLKQVKSLPDISPLQYFRAIYLDTMNGLRNLDPLGEGPALEYVRFSNARNLEPSDILPVLRAPHIKAVSVGFGSLRKNQALKALLGERGIGTSVPNIDTL
jgi:hypothetical protein